MFFRTEQFAGIELDRKSSCNSDDACWAFEACDADITEAWGRISFARRLILNTELTIKQLVQEDPDYVVDDFKNEVADAYETQKTKVKAQINKRKYITPEKPREQWTPVKNPSPLSDEPWFTGSTNS